MRPADAANLAKTIRELFADAETALLAKVAATLATGMDSPGWAQLKLASMQGLLVVVDQILADLEAATPGAVEAALNLAYAEGASSASAGLAEAGAGSIAYAPVRPNSAIAAMVASTVETLPVQVFQIRRAVTDIYQQVITRTTAQVSLGVMTRREASRAALLELAQNGVTSFQDKSGRRWNMASYTEMAVRSGAMSASLQGVVDRMARLEHDLVIVDDAIEECEKCRPFEGKVLSVTGARAKEKLSDGVKVFATLDAARAAGLFHPNCFPAGVLVSVPSSINAADSRWYDGELVVIHTASGNELPVTPNHPVLTLEGWIGAGSIEVSQSVLSYGLGDGTNTVGGPDEELIEASIGDVFHSLRESVSMTTMTVPGAAEQFHGDGVTNSDIEVVFPNSLLTDNGMTGLSNPISDGKFVTGRVAEIPLLADGSLEEVSIGSLHSPDSVMGGSGEGGTLCRRHAGEAASHRLASIDRLVSVAAEPGAEGRLADADGGRRLALSLLSSEVSLDRVVKISRSHFSGHVYNLEALDGWYVANSIVVHNCRHAMGIYLPGITKREPAKADPEGLALRERQRAFERRIRELKRRDAIDQELGGPEAITSRTKLRAKQQEFRQWREDNDRKDLSYRTSNISR